MTTTIEVILGCAIISLIIFTAGNFYIDYLQADNISALYQLRIYDMNSTNIILNYTTFLLEVNQNQTIQSQIQLIEHLKSHQTADERRSAFIADLIANGPDK